MRVLLYYPLCFVLILSTGACVNHRPATSTASAQEAEIPSGQGSSLTNWPALVGGKYVLKTFRFRPASIEWHAVQTRRLSYTIIFKIEDKNVPAEFFMARCWDTEVDRFRKILEADDGYITVTAFGVNDKIPKEKFKGDGEYWLDGRMLLGDLQTKP